jgi:hypothetical protein
MRTMTVAGIVVAALIVGSALVLYSSSSFQNLSPKSTLVSASISNASSSPSSTSSTSTNSSAWTVISSNATVYGNLACLDTVAILYPVSCPPAIPGSSPSLSVEIISYHGEVLYDANISIGVNGQPIIHTMWFTNSTIFCVSPMVDEHKLCPVHPIEPAITISTPESSASATNPSNGLRLDLQLSANSSGNLYVTVDAYNTLDSVNNVTGANDWAIPSNSLRSICDNQVAAYAVYQGNYGADNFTNASPLVLDTPGAGNICQVLSPSAVYSFSPESGVAHSQAGVFSPVAMSKNVTLSDSSYGYYTCGTTAPSFKPQNGSGLWTCGTIAPSFNPFPPGGYTVVALDQWGDVAVLQFTVTDG